MRDFQISTVYRAVPDDFMTRAIGESQKVPARVWKAALAGLMAFVPLDKPIACPTLVLGGDQDAVHALHWEDPEHFAGLISESTGRPRRRPSAA